MKYDYIIKNGTLVDFDKMTTAVGDVYIGEGKIVPPPADKGTPETVKAVKFGESAATTQVIDASGKYVLPGLFDTHAHMCTKGSFFGVNPQIAHIPFGVTSAVDPGTCGTSNFDQFYQIDIQNNIPDVYALINIAMVGIIGIKSIGTRPEDLDPKTFQVDAIRRAFGKYPGVIRGIKVRIAADTLDGRGIEVLESTISAAEKVRADGHFCVVGVHYDDLPKNVTVRQLTETLRPGDIFFHPYQTHGETIYNTDGTVLECVKAAQKRGIIFDTGNARVYWSFDHLRKSFADGFYPDIISTDLVGFSIFESPVFSQPHTMGVYSAAGMDDLSVLKAVTQTPARTIGVFDRKGSLDAGKLADITILDIVDASHKVFRDFYGGEQAGNKMFIPQLTMKNGKTVYRQVDFWS